MMLTITMTLIMYNSLMFLWLFNPIPIIISIIIQTSMIALILSITILSSWLPLILLLILIGGMMILFIYMASLIPNKINTTKMNIFIPVISLIFIFQMIMMNFMNPHSNLKKESYNYLENLFCNETFMLMNNLFSFNNFQIMMFMALYLLITMIIIIKITSPSKGPLQQKN